MITHFRKSILIALAILSRIHGFGLPLQVVEKPNIIVIYVDDLDSKDLGCYGGTVETPNIDQLAESGTRFTNYYASSPVCSPSRYSLLTGEYASRSKSIQDNHPLNSHAFIRWNTNITPGDYTVSGILRQHGYVAGMVGKWHNWQDGLPDLIHVPDIADPNQPQIQRKIEKNYEKTVAEVKESGGFDSVDALYGTNLAWLPITKKLMHHNQHWVTYHALKFIEKNQHQPFFLYLSTTLPHSPNPLKSLKGGKIQATPAGYKMEHASVQPSYENILTRAEKAGPFASEREKGKYAGMIWLDDGIGALLKKLEALHIRKKTLIIFASDHGTDAKMVLNKGMVPLIVNWEGHWPEGKTEDALVSNIDIAPTIFQATNVTPPPKMCLDGLSLLPLLQQKSPPWRNSLFLEITYSRAVVTQDWKYIAVRFPDPIQEKVDHSPPKTFNQEGTEYSVGSYDQEKVRFNADINFPAYYDPDQLYHRVGDPEEQKNLADLPSYREQLEEMKSLLRHYSEELPHEFGEFTQAKK